MEKRYISPKELSEYTGLKLRTIYNWIYRKKIPYIKVDKGMLCFDIKEIDRFFSSKKVKILTKE